MFGKFNAVLFIPTARELEKVFGIKETKLSGPFRYAFFKNFPIIITGIGKTNAAITASLFFKEYSPEKAVLTGICGAYRASGLNTGDVVSVTDDYFADEGSFDGRVLTTLQEKGMPVCENGRVYFEALPGFRTAVSNTVSFIPAENVLSEIYRIKTGAQVENMEGAAFGLAALKAGIKVSQLRSVSNYCGTAPEWNIKKAASSLFEAVSSFTEKYPSQ